LELTVPTANRAEITTIESILLRAYEDLSETLKSKNELEEENIGKLKNFLEKLKIYSEGKHFPLTFKLRDPSGNSNIKNPFAPRIDKNMEIRYFKRTREELIAMGYNPANTE
jgi:C4-type Zn-finger protein